MKPTLNSALALCVGALAAACTTTPTLPGDFELKRATLAAGAADTLLVLDGPGNKATGAAGGAAKGGSIGFLLGGLACLGAGPLAPLCLGTVVPAGLAIGAAGGAVVGAVRAESASDVEHQREVLDAALVARPDLHTRLRVQVQQQSAPGSAPPAVPGAQPDWLIQVDVKELGADVSGSQTPYALRLAATLTVRRRGEFEPVYVKRYEARSKAALTTDAWRANASEPLHGAVNDMLATLAAAMVGDLPKG